MELRLVVFDMDGVILDSMDTLALLASCAIAEFFRIPILDAQRRYNATIGVPFRQQLEIIFPAHPPVMKDSVASIYEQKHQLVLPLLKTADSAKSLIWSLRSRGIGSALISSTDAKFIQQMEQIQKLDFDHVRGYSSLYSGNGHTKALQLTDVLHESSVRAEEALMVGDTKEDQYVAAAVGTHFRLTTCKDLYADVHQALTEIRL